MDEKIKQGLPEAQRVEEAKEESKAMDQHYVNYQIKNKEFSFAKMFNFLNELKRTDIIDSFQITQANLEQIFLYFSRFQINTEPAEWWPKCCIE